MLEVATALRTGYINALAGLTLDGVSIPVFDERVTGPTAQFMYGAIPVEAYVLLTSQTETDNSPKCNFETECSITVDVNTKFQKGTGGKLLSERISNAIKQIIYPGASNALDIGEDFQVYGTKMGMSKGLIEFGTTNDNYRKVILFIHQISQLTT